VLSMVSVSSALSPCVVKLACRCEESVAGPDTSSPQSTDGNHTDSAWTRPTIDRVISGPEAIMTEITPKSFHRIPPSSFTRRSEPRKGMPCIRTVALQIIPPIPVDYFFCFEWKPSGAV
jgi:hypothetical protein